MRVVGLDLAGLPGNNTGVCTLEDGDERMVSASVVRSDEEIIEHILSCAPELVSVDAPLNYTGVERECDIFLRKFGQIPPSVRGMRVLADRGRILASRIAGSRIKCVEVCVRASANILGLSSKDDFTVQKRLLGLGLCGDISDRILSRDELDSIVAAVTGLLHLKGDTELLGGQVVLPVV
jgi:predicted nuclease with RNAse H fold